jgi:hypothetical protein
MSCRLFYYYTIIINSLPVFDRNVASKNFTTVHKINFIGTYKINLQRRGGGGCSSENYFYTII